MNVGRGFPTTFGLVIAAIVAAIAIQLFILRDKRRTKSESTEGRADGFGLEQEATEETV